MVKKIIILSVLIIQINEGTEGKQRRGQGRGNIPEVMLHDATPGVEPVSTPLLSAKYVAPAVIAVGVSVAAALTWYFNRSAPQSVTSPMPELGGFNASALEPCGSLSVFNASEQSLLANCFETLCANVKHVLPLFNLANGVACLSAPKESALFTEVLGRCNSDIACVTQSLSVPLDLASVEIDFRSKNLALVQEGYFQTGTRTLATGRISNCVAFGLISSSGERLLAHINGEIISAMDSYLSNQREQNPLDSIKKFIERNKGRVKSTLVSGSSPNIDYLHPILKDWGLSESTVIINPAWRLGSSANQGNLIIKDGEFYLAQNPQGFESRISALSSHKKDKPDDLRQHRKK